MTSDMLKDARNGRVIVVELLGVIMATSYIPVAPASLREYILGDVPDPEVLRTISDNQFRICKGPALGFTDKVRTRFYKNQIHVCVVYVHDT